MVDSGLLEPLLPEVYNAIADDRAPYFWKMLEVLDRTVQSGRKISDPVLLSVLLLPWIMEELEREEKRRDGRMRIGEVLLFIRELIQPICARMALAAGTRHQIETGARDAVAPARAARRIAARSSASSIASRSTTRSRCSSCTRCRPASTSSNTNSGARFRRKREKRRKKKARRQAAKGGGDGVEPTGERAATIAG